MLMFMDFETNNLPDFNRRARDPSQPHIVQAAFITCDNYGKEIETWQAIARPDGWTIPEELTRDVHGISTEHALKVGIPEREIGIKTLQFIKKASLICAYNSTFDKFIARICMRRFDLMQDEHDAWWKALPMYCVMRPMTDVCRLPGKRPGQFKFPKLQEAYKHAFGLEFEGAHDAMCDLRATKELFFYQRNELKLC